MAFRKPVVQPEFADLKGTLAQSRNELGNATYQTIQEIIERLTRFRGITIDQIADKLDEVAADARYANKFASFITREDETSVLPNSIQLLAGTGITLDYSVANQLTISATGGAGAYYDAPLTDGDVDETDLIFADGECVIVQVPNIP